MDSNSTQLCCLCLETSDDLINTFEEFQDSTIASILAKHFWFQVDSNDSMSESLCQTCWIQTKMFHDFYKRIEFRHGKNCRSNVLINVDAIKKERCESPRKEALEPDSLLVKCEETEPPEQITDSLINKEENIFDYKEFNDDQIGNSEENSQSSDDEDQPPYKTSKITDGNSTLSRNNERKSYNWHSRAEKEQQDAQIRELFNMKCEICSDVDFETLLKARQHYRKIHKTSGYLSCCGKKFRRRHLILNHIRYHTDPSALRCDQCGKRFQDKYRLQNHISSHVPLDSRAHKCSLCSSSFAKVSLLRLHVNSTHSSKTGEKFPCDKCDKSFRSKLLLSCHTRCVHEFSLEHVCDICARRFKTKQILQNHILCEHSTQTKAQCNICGAWLKHEAGLRQHLKRHQEIENANCKNVNCPICEKVVKSKSVLVRHIRYAHSEKRFKCGLCDKEFKVAKNLKEHIACHTGEDLYNCPYCEKKFKSSGNLYSHRKNAHLAEWTRDFSQRITVNEKLKE